MPNIFSADFRKIRRITEAGVVTSIAGNDFTGTPANWSDGTGTDASFGNLRGICMASNGDLYVIDGGVNTTGGMVRRVTQAGVVTTIAGSPTLSGSTDGTGSAARFRSTQGVCVSPSGDLFVADMGSQTIRRVTTAGVVTTFAGQPDTQGYQDGTGYGALFSFPYGIACDSGGNLFVSEATYIAPYNYTIRKITPLGVVTTFAGSFGQSGTTDGTGSAARFSSLGLMAIDSSNNLYVTDNTRIRKITSAAVVTTVGGTQGDLSSPIGLAMGPAGMLYISDIATYVIRQQQT